MENEKNIINTVSALGNFLRVKNGYGADGISTYVFT